MVMSITKGHCVGVLKAVVLDLCVGNTDKGVHRQWYGCTSIFYSRNVILGMNMNLPKK